MEKTIVYEGAEICVSGEVADFLEQDRKRIQAQERQVRRHLSRSSFEQLEVTKYSANDADAAFDLVEKRIQLQQLDVSMKMLSTGERQLVERYYWEEMRMQTIGAIIGVSKVAVSKQMKKLLHKLCRLMET